MGAKKNYEEYKKNHTREKNKIRKITKTMKFQPNNLELLAQIEKLQEKIK